MDLSVELPSKKKLSSLTLQDCLNNFFASETMMNSGYKCEKCKKQVNIEKNISVWSYPRLLCITLKRFSQEGGFRKKISSSVKIPLNGLDMKPYAKADSNHASIPKASYKLYGVSHHSGSLSGGHYVCEV